MKKLVNGIEVPLTEDEILAIQIEQETHALAEAKTQYIRDRLSRYPSFGDQLDMMYHDKVNGTNLWFELIQDIKQQCPKPEGE